MSARLSPPAPRPAPLLELRDWLAGTAARLRTQRLFGPLARVEVARDITRDALADTAALGALAGTAEEHDRAALRLLDAALADGHVDRAELPALRRARAFVARSAATDSTLSRSASLPCTP